MKNAKWLKEQREKLNLTQRELATKIGLSPFAIQQIEQGVRVGSDETWERINSCLIELYKKEIDDTPEEIINYGCKDFFTILKNHIKKFGKDYTCYLVYKIGDNYFTRYSFYEEDLLFNPETKIDEDEDFIEATLENALKLFENQNKIIEKRKNEMKINELHLINQLNEKAGILLNKRIDNKFYDYYFENDIEWLLNNKNKIESDFANNIEKMKFQIILNSHLEERTDLILSLKKVEIEEFSNYINYIPYNQLKKKEQLEIQKTFENFKNLDSYKSLQYFEQIRRK